MNAKPKVNMEELPWGFFAFIAYILMLTGIMGGWIMQMIASQ